MASITIAKVTAIPSTIEKNVIYFLKNGTSFDIYASDSEGTLVLKGLGGKADISNMMTLINQKANISDLANVASGGTVTLTKEAVGLGNVDNTSDLGKPISTATQAQLDSKVNINDLTRTAVGLSNVENTSDQDKPVSNATLAALNLKADLSLVSNVDNTKDIDKPVSSATLAALNLKADGADLTALKSSITTTLGGQSTLINQKANALDLTTHEMDTSNPHKVTKDQVSLGNVENTADIDKPISRFTQGALNLKADITYVDEKVAAITTGSSVTLDKNSVGLGNVDNTSDLSKPVSTAAQAALDLKVNVADMANYVSGGTVTFSKASVGLGSVDNTSDLLKPISIATQASLNSKADQVAFDAFKSQTVNSLSLKLNIADLESQGKVALGLDQVDNTSDINKPVSTATANAIALKANYLDMQTKLSYKLDVADLPAVTKASVGLSNADNTSDLGKPVSNATQAALNLKLDILSFNTSFATLNSILDTKITAADLPLLNKASLGLDQVDNTDDMSKPVSVPTINALAKKVDITTFDAFTTDFTANISPTTVGLGNVDNTSDISKPISTATSTALALKADITYVDTAIAQIATGNPTLTLNKNSVGLDQVDNTSDISKPVSIATATALSLKADKSQISSLVQTELNGYIPNVTASDIGLGNVDNTSDLSKPVSTATSAALSLMATQVQLGDVKTYVDSSLALKLNISDLTSQSVDQLGLGNVDNTSDKDKPLSTAVIAALALKADLIYVNDNLSLKVNIADLQNLTAESVGLGNVDNTSDLGKPLSNAAIAALSLKADSTTVSDINSSLTSGLNNKVDKTTYLTDQTNLNNTISTFAALGANTIIPNQW